MVAERARRRRPPSPPGRDGPRRRGHPPGPPPYPARCRPPPRWRPGRRRSPTSASRPRAPRGPQSRPRRLGDEVPRRVEADVLAKPLCAIATRLGREHVLLGGRGADLAVHARLHLGHARGATTTSRCVARSVSVSPGATWRRNFAAVDAGEEPDGARAARALDEHRRCEAALGERLHDDDARQHRMVREVPADRRPDQPVDVQLGRRPGRAGLAWPQCGSPTETGRDAAASPRRPPCPQAAASIAFSSVIRCSLHDLSILISPSVGARPWSGPRIARTSALRVSPIGLRSQGRPRSAPTGIDPPRRPARGVDLAAIRREAPKRRCGRRSPARSTGPPSAGSRS